MPSSPPFALVVETLRSFPSPERRTAQRRRAQGRRRPCLSHSGASRDPRRPQVDYAWRVVHPRPDRVPIRARKRRIRSLRRPRRRGALLRRPPAAAPSFPHPEPSDLQRTLQIRSAQPFALHVLHKSPCSFLLSTRSPGDFKNNYSWAQLLADNPLAFHRIEPAVRT